MQMIRDIADFVPAIILAITAVSLAQKTVDNHRYIRAMKTALRTGQPVEMKFVDGRKMIVSVDGRSAKVELP